MKQKKKIKLRSYKAALVVVWGVCLLLMAIGYFAFYQPLHESLEQSKRQLTESSDILMVAQRASKPGTLDSLLERCDQSRDLVGNYAIHEEDVTDMVFDVGQIANQLGLSEYSSNIQEKVAVSTVEKSPSLSESWLSVKFMGTYNQFANFVNELERNHPIVFVERVSFQRDNQTADRNEIRMDLSFIATKRAIIPPVAKATSR